MKNANGGDTGESGVESDDAQSQTQSQTQAQK
jgi:hypothetical protein